jgi:hypothetical protein
MIIAIGNHLINMANVSHITLRDMSGNVRIEFIGGGTFTLSRPDSEWFQAWAETETRLYRFLDVTAPGTARRPPDLRPFAWDEPDNHDVE